MQAGLRCLFCLHVLEEQSSSYADQLRLQISQQYLACLKENANDAAKCRELSKLYLQCRMDRSVCVSL